MPAPLAKGIIIAASVLVAAGIAAYENQQFREWLERSFEKSREKIAVAFQSMGDNGRTPESRHNDRSMSEDQDEKAEERRRQARQDIIDRGRKLQERNKRRKLSSEGPGMNEKVNASADALVGENAKSQPGPSNVIAHSSAIENMDMAGNTRTRRVDRESERSPRNEPIDASTLLGNSNDPAAETVQPWESRYEQEMRNTWNIPLPERAAFAASAHDSESLLDLTPTTEDFPDPEVSLPSSVELERPLGHTEYFSVPPSRTSGTISEAGTDSEYQFARPNRSTVSSSAGPFADRERIEVTRSLAGSVADSHGPAHFSELDSEDDFSEIGDGIRTPASVWTEVGSSVSGDA